MDYFGSNERYFVLLTPIGRVPLAWKKLPSKTGKVFNLTSREQVLLAVILFCFLIGMAVKLYRERTALGIPILIPLIP
ncbi:MAG: hypothetical protein C5B47_05235 [Verrucomicrobia bacterium]|nr:MAG: hypothetical protein C5B47_05235 [Verrucomicrobiota bacterium]